MAAHSNRFISFLRHYGPIASSDAMYDELIQNELTRHAVSTPIEIPPAKLDALLINLRGDTPHNVILTGTAGDGKTFHCRRTWETLGGTHEGWVAGGKVARTRLPSGRTLVVIKDLSELKADEKRELMPRISAAVQGAGDGEVYLVAANDGQLLSTWRQHAEGSPEEEAVFGAIEAMLVDGKTQHERLNLRLFNLSQQDATEHFDALIEQVVEHPQWEACTGCPLMEDPEHSRCPIRINRERLRAGQPLRARLLQLVSLAAANRLHLPIRHLLLLSVNILLGDAKPPQRLLTCRTAQNRADQSDYAVTNPYGNVFGRNLPASARSQYQAFTVLESFGIGQETNNAFDNLLVYGPHAEAERFDRLVGNDPYYGGPAYAPHLRGYLEGERTDTREVLRALERQRQRLFFSLPTEEPLDPWHLTVYRHAAQFMRFRAALRSDDDVHEITEHLVRGLNRTFCGMMIDDTNDVLLASSGGDGRGKIASVLRHRVPTRRRPRQPYIEFDLPAEAHNPRLLAIDPMGGNDRDSVLVALDLQLTHFEYLMRVACGSLPASFSRQCFEDFLDLKLRLIEEVDRIEGEGPARPGEVVFHAITVDEAGRAQVDDIPIRIDS